MRQKPSDKSIFENMIVSSAGTSAMNRRRRGRTRPSSLTGYSGESLVVVSLTAGARCTWASACCRARLRPQMPDCTAKERSNKSRPRRPVWGMTARGETFNCGGGALRTSAHERISEKPAVTWYSISSAMRRRASGVRALVCGPRLTAVSMAAWLQAPPQSTGTPVAHCSRVATNGWKRIQGSGSMRRRRLP